MSQNYNDRMEEIATDLLDEETVSRLNDRGISEEDIVRFYHELDQDRESLNDKVDIILGDVFSMFLNQMDRDIENLEKQLEMKKKLRKGIIQSLITGRIKESDMHTVEE